MFVRTLAHSPDYTSKVDELYALAHPKVEAGEDGQPGHAGGLTFPLNPMLTTGHAGFVQGMPIGGPMLTNPTGTLNGVAARLIADCRKLFE